MQTDTEEFKKLQKKKKKKGGTNRAKSLASSTGKLLGESCNNANVVGEGFGIINGEFLTKSFVFNSSNDDYHNDSWEMHAHSTKCVRKVVEWWKKAGSNYLDCPNHSVKSLLSSDNDLTYTAGVENVWVLISTFDRMRQGLFVLFVWNDPFKDLKLLPHVLW